MAQWQALSALFYHNEQVRERVNELSRRSNFPYKFRGMFAQWIESQDWSEIDFRTDDGMKRGEILFKELMMMIEGKCQQQMAQQDLDMSLDLQNAKRILQQRFEGNYEAFVSVINRCLSEERLLIQSAYDTGDDTELRRKNKKETAPEQQTISINRTLENLQHEIDLNDSRLEDAFNKQQEFSLKFSELTDTITKLDAQLAAADSEITKKEYRDRKQNAEKWRTQETMLNFQRRTEIADALINLAVRLAQQLTVIYNESEMWKITEKRAIAAFPKHSEISLDVIDKLYDESGKLLRHLIQQVEKAITLFEQLPYANDEKLTKLKTVHVELKGEYLETHLQSGFVIDRHPERVLKVSSGKSLGFTMSVRILGGCGLGLDFNPPSVKVALFHERDLNDVTDTSTGVCKICNGNERRFTIVAKNEELVTEHKYAFIFRTEVQILGVKFPLKVTSLPVILTSQTSQEIMAKATLIWDAAFSDQDRKPFQYRDSVPWGDVAVVLSNVFSANTGRGLTKDHLNYLARMAFRSKCDIENVDKKEITEKQVIRDKLPGREFSFWKWFWANMNLCKSYVKKEWTDGLIYGFISKDDAKRKLMDSPTGTFLLRFSETNIESSQRSDICGYLTLAVMEIDPKTCQKKLFHVKEYLSPKDLGEKGLSPILDAMEVADNTRPGTKKHLLRYVWPDTNTTFEARFGSFIQEREQTDGDYRRGKYTIEIYLTDDRQVRHRQNSLDLDSNPSTPCAPSPQSYASAMSPSAQSTIYESYLNGDYPSVSVMNDVEQQPLFVAPVPSPRQAIVHPLLPSDVGNPETYNLELVNGILQDLEMSQLEQIILDADPTSSSANMEMTYDNDGDLLFTTQ